MHATWHVREIFSVQRIFERDVERTAAALGAGHREL
jgi:hypothetical protein